MYKNKLEEEGTLFMKNLVAKADRSSRTTRTLGFGLALLLAGVSVASYSKVTKSVVRNTENKSSLTQAVKLGQAKVSGAVGKAEATKKALNLPLAFEANQGQSPSIVAFQARSFGYDVYLKNDNSAVMISQNSVGKPAAVRMKFLGANAAATGQARNKQLGVSNYIFGTNRSKWFQGVPQYGEVVYSNIYKGIDVVYKGNHNRLEHDFIVSPGTDPNQIQVAYEGASVKLGKVGELIVKTPNGNYKQLEPYIYQENAGRRTTVKGSYVLTASNTIRYAVGSHDSSQPLIIDPTLQFAEYYGTLTGVAAVASGPGATQLYGVATNGNNVYVTGTTTIQTNFELLSAAFTTFAGPPVGGADAVVAAFTASGTPVYSTYFGGPGNEKGVAIQVDAAGNAYVAGETTSLTTQSLPFGTLGGPVSGLTDSFLIKLTPTGALASGRFIAGINGLTTVGGLAIDGVGNTYVAGSTTAPSFDNGGNVIRGLKDAYVIKVNSDMTTGWKSILGGSQDDVANGIAILPGGDLAVVGTTKSPVRAYNNNPNCVVDLNFKGFPIFPATTTIANADATCRSTRLPVRPAFQGFVQNMTFGAPATTVTATAQAFVARLSATDGNSASSGRFVTLFGSSGATTGDQVTGDSQGNIIIAGTDTSATPAGAVAGIPAARASAQGGFNTLAAPGAGLTDGYIAKINTVGSEVLESRYLGHNASLGDAVLATCVANQFNPTTHTGPGCIKGLGIDSNEQVYLTYSYAGAGTLPGGAEVAPNTTGKTAADNTADIALLRFKTNFQLNYEERFGASAAAPEDVAGLAVNSTTRTVYMAGWTSDAGAAGNTVEDIFGNALALAALVSPTFAVPIVPATIPPSYNTATVGLNANQAGWLLRLDFKDVTETPQVITLSFAEKVTAGAINRNPAPGVIANATIVVPAGTTVVSASNCPELTFSPLPLSVTGAVNVSFSGNANGLPIGNTQKYCTLNVGGAATDSASTIIVQVNEIVTSKFNTNATNDLVTANVAQASANPNPNPPTQVDTNVLVTPDGTVGTFAASSIPFVAVVSQSDTGAPLSGLSTVSGATPQWLTFFSNANGNGAVGSGGCTLMDQGCTRDYIVPAGTQLTIRTTSQPTSANGTSTNLPPGTYTGTITLLAVKDFESDNGGLAGPGITTGTTARPVVIDPSVPAKVITVRMVVTGVLTPPGLMIFSLKTFASSTSNSLTPPTITNLQTPGDNGDTLLISSNSAAVPYTLFVDVADPANGTSIGPANLSIDTGASGITPAGLTGVNGTPAHITAFQGSLAPGIYLARIRAQSPGLPDVFADVQYTIGGALAVNPPGPDHFNLINKAFYFDMIQGAAAISQSFTVLPTNNNSNLGRVYTATVSASTPWLTITAPVSGITGASTTGGAFTLKVDPAVANTSACAPNCTGSITVTVAPNSDLNTGLTTLVIPVTLRARSTVAVGLGTLAVPQQLPVVVTIASGAGCANQVNATKVIPIRSNETTPGLQANFQLINPNPVTSSWLLVNGIAAPNNTGVFASSLNITDLVGSVTIAATCVSGLAPGIYTTQLMMTIPNGVGGVITQIIPVSFYNNVTVGNTALGQLGVFRNGTFYMDRNSSLAFEKAFDTYATFGQPGDIPVAGDWDGTGVVRIGVYRPSNATWYLDMNNNGTWDGVGTGLDTSFVFGLPGSNDVPVFGDWNGTGVTKVGIFRNGTWYLDLNNNHAWDPGVDGTFFYGQPGDLPIVSNWNGQGTGDQIGVFRNGTWFVDNNGDGVYPLTGTLDAQYVFGQAGDIPVVGNWDGLGRKRIGVFRGNGLWFLDSDGSNSWTPGTDAGSVIPIIFGQTGDKPIIGTWTMPPMLLP
jgi:hypothetical protein